MRGFVRAFSEGLRLPKTSLKIVGLLANRGQLSVRQIVRLVRASERSVRMNLALLMRRGLLQRRVLVTTKKKLAYSYFLPDIPELLVAAEREFSSTVTRLQLFARRAAGD